MRGETVSECMHGAKPVLLYKQVWYDAPMIAITVGKCFACPAIEIHLRVDITNPLTGDTFPLHFKRWIPVP